jgi:hypothetical protein
MICWPAGRRGLQLPSALTSRRQPERGPLLGPNQRQIHQALDAETARQPSSIAAATIGGATKASDSVMRIERSVLPSRAAMVAVV